ncbi:hypothetical protein RRG08_000362 [Elysia crispata]|uniref:Uncharacterized protein n=1 Tax=Elysia crispata TaxID=231223 RepID=A0AAE1BG34_9GAST|nr:hypothetical protein RRG08_000362 [Elysia crispata]
MRKSEPILFTGVTSPGATRLNGHSNLARNLYKVTSSQSKAPLSLGVLGQVYRGTPHKIFFSLFVLNPVHHHERRTHHPG